MALVSQLLRHSPCLNFPQQRRVWSFSAAGFQSSVHVTSQEHPCGARDAEMLPTPESGCGSSAWGKLSQPHQIRSRGCVWGRWKAREEWGCGLRTWEDEGDEFQGCMQEEAGDDCIDGGVSCKGWRELRGAGKRGGMHRRELQGGGSVEGCTGDRGKWEGLGGM